MDNARVRYRLAQLALMEQWSVCLVRDVTSAKFTGTTFAGTVKTQILKLKNLQSKSSDLISLLFGNIRDPTEYSLDTYISLGSILSQIACLCFYFSGCCLWIVIMIYLT